MPLTNVGRDELAKAIVGDPITPWGAGAYVGVGDSTAVFAATQTDLQGTKFRKPMNGGFPQRSVNTLTYEATFSESEANYAWAEWGVFTGPAPGGLMLNRKVQALGTKTSADQWKITATVTVTAA